MTVCIAAACSSKNTKKIVLCADQKSSSQLGSAETAHKIIVLGHSWVCLTAGDEPDILALVRLYQEQFSDPKNLTATTIDASMKAPLRRRKAELVEEFIFKRFAISFDEFMKEGKGRLSTEHFFDATQRISQIRLNAELIIAGFIAGEPEIYYTDNEGTARAAANFAVVGEGEYVAHSALLRRAQHDWTPLYNTLYNVFEAKKLSEKIGSVGIETDMGILDKTGDYSLTSLAFDRQLEEWYKKYGPQDLPHDDLTYEGELHYVFQRKK